MVSEELEQVTRTFGTTVKLLYRTANPRGDHLRGDAWEDLGIGKGEERLRRERETPSSSSTKNCSVRAAIISLTADASPIRNIHLI
jgi:hypothetical protein